MQPTLFDAPIQPPAGKASTSHAAARSMTVSSRSLRAQIVGFLSHATFGATDEEISQALCMQGNTERPRRGELLQMRLIEDSGQRRRTKSGRAAIVWRLTAMGVDAVAAARAVGVLR